MKKDNFWWRPFVLVTFALFTISMVSGLILQGSTTEQWQYYEAGRKAYLNLQCEQAAEDFRASLADYHQRVASGPVFFTASGSLEMAALATHFSALCLVKKGTANDLANAVLTFNDGLMLTTDKAIADLIPTEMSVIAANPATSADVLTALAKIRRDRRIDQIDLEILYRNQKELAEKEGKGGSGENKDQQMKNRDDSKDRDKL
jgi:hypothetical protein